MKKYRPGITEKRMSNKRFRRTEDAILRVFFEEDYYVSMEVLARRIGVARSTLYYHHKAISRIIPDYEGFLLRKYRRKIRRLLAKKNTRMRALYVGALFFILQNREYFSMIIQTGNRGVLTKMIDELTPKVERVMGLPRNSAKIMKIYTSEVIEVVWMWGEDGFEEQRIDMVLEDVMFLTTTVRQRLRPMLNL